MPEPKIPEFRSFKDPRTELVDTIPEFTSTSSTSNIPEFTRDQSLDNIPVFDSVSQSQIQRQVGDPTDDRHLALETLSGVGGGIASSIEQFGRAGRTLGIPGSGALVSLGQTIGKPFGPTREDLLAESLRGGIESTIQSIVAGVPGLVAGGLAGGATGLGFGAIPGAAGGFATSAGIIFSLAEYDKFMEELETTGRNNGMTDQQVAELKDQMTGQAVVSAAAEGGLEALSDLAQFHIFKFFGKTGISAPIKQGLKHTLNRFLINSGKVAAVELPTELATTAIQTTQREEAGIPTAGVNEGLKRTIGPVLVQSMLRAGGGQIAQRFTQEKPAELDIAVALGISKFTGLDSDNVTIDAIDDISNGIRSNDSEQFVKSIVDVGRTFLNDEDQQVANDFVKADNDEWSDNQINKFVTVFDNYLKDGSTTNKTLQPTLQRLKQLSVDIFSETTNADISKEVRDFMVSALNVDETIYTQNNEVISNYADLFWGSEFALREIPKAQEIAGEIIESEGLLQYQVNNVDRTFFTRMMRTLGTVFTRKNESLAMVNTIEQLYDMTGKKDNAGIEALKLKHPKRFDVAEKIVKWFAEVREEIKTHKRNMIQAMKPEFTQAFDAFVRGLYGKGGEQIQKKSKKILVNRLIKKNDLDKKEARQFRKLTEEYRKVDTWGIDDYITKIEQGTWKVIDNKGQVRAVAITRDLADEKLATLRKSGDIKGEVKITQEYSKLDPLKKRKSILRGEENIFNALMSYSFAIRKRLILEPVVLKAEQTIAENPEIFTPNVKGVVRRQLDTLKGTYSKEDQFVDWVFKNWNSGGRPFRASRFVGSARKYEGILKLGYRPVASAVNLLFGHAHTITKTGLGHWARAVKESRKPEGKKFLKKEEPFLGITFGEFEGGARGAISALHPMWLFAAPERGIRRVALLANFNVAKEQLGMDDEQARKFAHRSMRAQSFVYNMTAMPRWMRTPTGKLVGQFKSYIIQEVQFLSQLSGKEWGRYISLMSLLGGPQTVVHILHSIPMLASMGIIDKLEEWLLSVEIPEEVPLVRGAKPLFGLPGLLGVDISISAAIQLPSSVDELAGPFVSDMLKVWGILEDVLATGFSEGTGLQQFLDADTPRGKIQAVTGKMSAFMVELNYINDILTTFYTVQPDGRIWARDRLNRPAYPVESSFDIIKLVMGAKPIQKAVYQNKMRIFQREKQRRLKQAKVVIDRGVQLFNSEGRLPDDFIEDLLRAGVFDPSGFVKIIENRQMLPEDRAIQGEAIAEKLRALDLFYDNMYREFGDDVLSR